MSERFTVRLEDLLTAESHAQQFLSDVQGKCIVANGCFDVLHPGHLSLLANLDTIAYQMKLRPIVAINSDGSVRRLKGNTRPIVTDDVRAHLINNLKWPFTVVIFCEDTPQLLMDTLKPRAVLKGSEYAAESVVRWTGSQVITVPMVGTWSTTKILGDTR